MLKVKWIASDVWTDVDGFTVRVWETFDDWHWMVVRDAEWQSASDGYADSMVKAQRAALRALAKARKRVRP